MTSPAALNAVILAGGLGTRLAPVLGRVPKGLAPIRGRPFLDLLLEYVVRQGIPRVVFCVGHLREAVMERYAQWPGVQTDFSVESEPLGTGGALQHVLHQVTSDRFYVLNGDSFCDVDLRALLSFHLAHEALATLTVTLPAGREDIGSVQVDGAGRVTSFQEKAPHGDGRYLMNAGVYVLERSALVEVRQGRSSLEHELIPSWAERGRCFGYKTTAGVIDIGTPERYARAQQNL